MESKLERTTVSKGLRRLTMATGHFSNLSKDDLTELIDTWYLLLSDLSDERVKVGFIEVARKSTSNYNPRPRPGDIREVTQKGSVISWDAAFQEIMRNAPKVLNQDFMGGQFIPILWSSKSVYDLMNRTGNAIYYASLEDSKIETAKAQFRQSFENYVYTSGSQVLLESYQTSSEPLRMSEADIQIFAIEKAKDMMQRFKHALTDEQYDANVERAAGLVLRNKRSEQMQLPSPQENDLSRIEPSMRQRVKVLAQPKPQEPNPKAQVLAKRLEKSVGLKSQAEVVGLVAAKLTRQSGGMN